MFKIKLPIRAFTLEEWEMQEKGLLPDDAQGSLIKDYIFYKIDAISYDSWRDNESIIYAGGDTFGCPLPVKEVEKRIDSQLSLIKYN